MSRYSPNSITVTESFARAVAAWSGLSFKAVMKDVRSNLSGGMMNKVTGDTLRDVEKNSHLTVAGFTIGTGSPSLIAWMLGSQRKAFTVVPRAKKVLSWVDKSGKRVFARKVNIPAWKFTPKRPVLQDALDKNKSLIKRIFEAEILAALSRTFPDVRIDWRLSPRS